MLCHIHQVQRLYELHSYNTINLINFALPDDHFSLTEEKSRFMGSKFFNYKYINGFSIRLSTHLKNSLLEVTLATLKLVCSYFVTLYDVICYIIVVLIELAIKHSVYESGKLGPSHKPLHQSHLCLFWL